jgi:hypothetical protein
MSLLLTHLLLEARQHRQLVLEAQQMMVAQEVQELEEFAQAAEFEVVHVLEAQH